MLDNNRPEERCSAPFVQVSAEVGITASPGFFETVALIGKDTCLQRLEQALHYIDTNLSTD